MYVILQNKKGMRTVTGKKYLQGLPGEKYELLLILEQCI